MTEYWKVLWRSPLIYLYYTKITNIFQTTKNTFMVQCFPKTTCYYSFPYVNIEIDYYKYNNGIIGNYKEGWRRYANIRC